MFLRNVIAFHWISREVVQLHFVLAEPTRRVVADQLPISVTQGEPKRSRGTREGGGLGGCRGIFDVPEHALSLHALRDLETQQVEDGRGKIDQIDRLRDANPGRQYAVEAHDQGYAQEFVVDRMPVTDRFVIVEFFAVVRSEDDQCVVREAPVLEQTNQLAYVVVHTGYLGFVEPAEIVELCLADVHHTPAQMENVLRRSRNPRGRVAFDESFAIFLRGRVWRVGIEQVEVREERFLSRGQFVE